ncbi:50S ribosomal protein L20 [candidate division KSB1 bacterium]|nr:50S ribosomal protein L20 [candidate division KSB1 bacterium]RQW01600.1 MAG: 50S ribosomal protein L20 [candidate division KSB1 bacterium]
MPRSSSSVPTRQRRNKYLKAARGYWGGKSRLYRSAKEQVEKGMLYAYRDRRARRREFRSLWICRINAAARLFDMSYSQLIDGMNKKGLDINRKMLAELAVHDIHAFEEIVKTVRAA